MVACSVHATPVVYHRRQPEKTTLYQAVAKHLPAPSKAEIAAVAWSIWQGTVELLKKRGLWRDADETCDRLAQEQPLLATLASASTHERG